MSRIFSLSLTVLLTFLTQGHALTTQVVAWTGMSAGKSSFDSIYSTLGVTFSTFSNPVINDSGTVAFNATVRELLTWPFATPVALSAIGSQSLTTTSQPISVTPIPYTQRITNIWGGIWSIPSNNSPSLVVRTGSPYGIVDAGGYDDLGAPVLNNSNLCAFTGNYTPGYIYIPPSLPGQPVTNFLSIRGGDGLWLSTNISEPVAFVGESAPGYPKSSTTQSNLTFANWPYISSIDRIALPDNGRVVFSASVGVGTLTQHGVWVQSPMGPRLLAREGETLTVAGSNRAVKKLSFMSFTNGTAADKRSCDPRTGDIALSLTFADKSQGILIASPTGSNAISLVSLTGDRVPGGAVYDTFASFGEPAINRSGHVAFRAIAKGVTSYPVVFAPSLMPPATPLQNFTNSWEGIWCENAKGDLVQVVRTAPPIADIGGFTSFSDPLFNAAHQVAFVANKRPGFIMYPPGTFAGGSGVWTSRNLTNPVAWVGQTAPGYPRGLMISVKSPYGWSTNTISFKSTPPVINSIERIAFPNNGRLVVWATARATNDVPRPPVPKGIVVTQEIRSSVLSQRGIWIQNGSGAMELAVREGMSVSVNGTSKVISSLLSPTDAEPFKSRKTLCSDSNGMVVTTATFTDGTQGILKITP